MQKQGIFIPVKGAPYIVNTTIVDIKNLLSCKYCGYCSCSHMDDYGYRLCLFCDDMAASKNLSLNPLASSITYKYGEVHGPVVLIDDKKNLTLEDLSDIVKKVNSLPSVDYY